MSDSIKHLIEQNSIAVNEGVYYLHQPEQNDISAEKLYLEARIKERRIYRDEKVLSLPIVSKNNKHYSEWIIREATSKKLYSYLKKNKNEKSILELGCGNGWLSAFLARLPDSFVTGMDINHMELEQAARVFNKDNLLFVYANIYEKAADQLKFDYIILASSLSYFEDLEILIERLLSLLNDGGELHFIDNPSYNEKELEAARQRSKDYYRILGVYMMHKNYFHHDVVTAVKKYNYKILYNPNTIINKMLKKVMKNLSPFYWIKISKSSSN